MRNGQWQTVEVRDADGHLLGAADQDRDGWFFLCVETWPDGLRAKRCGRRSDPIYDSAGQALDALADHWHDRHETTWVSPA